MFVLNFSVCLPFSSIFTHFVVSILMKVFPKHTHDCDPVCVCVCVCARARVCVCALTMDTYIFQCPIHFQCAVCLPPSCTFGYFDLSCLNASRPLFRFPSRSTILHIIHVSTLTLVK